MAFWEKDFFERLEVSQFFPRFRECGASRACGVGGGDRKQTKVALISSCRAPGARIHQHLAPRADSICTARVRCYSWRQYSSAHERTSARALPHTQHSYGFLVVWFNRFQSVPGKAIA